MTRTQHFKEVIEDKLNLKASYEKVFCNGDGERVLRHLLKVSGLISPEIITDTNLLLVRQGQQHIVLTILKTINKDNSELIEQITESMKE